MNKKQKTKLPPLILIIERLLYHRGDVGGNFCFVLFCCCFFFGGGFVRCNEEKGWENNALKS